MLIRSRLQNPTCCITIRRLSEVTHVHPLATACCTVYIGVLAGLLEVRTPRESKSKAIRLIGFNELADMFVEMQMPPFDPGKWPGRGAAVLTLHIGLWAIEVANDFREGLTKVAEIGGDTDTYGAVAGGLLGAKFGLEGIPKEWREVLLGYEKMISLADQLYDSAHL